MSEPSQDRNRTINEQDLNQAFLQFGHAVSERLDDMKSDIEERLKSELTAYIDKRFSALELSIERRMNDNTWKLTTLIISVTGVILVAIGIAVAILKIT